MPENLENSAVAIGLEKVSIHSNFKEGQCQNCSNCHTIAFISHATKVMFKILQSRLQLYMNKEFPDVQARFRKGRGTEIKFPVVTGSWKKQGSGRKKSASLTTLNPLTMWITKNCGKFIKRWSTIELTCLLRNLYVGQEATVRTRHGTTDWLKTGKEVWQSCTLSSGLFNFYAVYIMWNAGLDESQAGIKIAGKHINSLRYADNTTLMAESEELKSLLMKVKGEWKSWLITQHSKN